LTTTCHLSRFAMSISRRATSAELSTCTSRITIFGTFVNCSRVDTRWQQYSTHLYTNSKQNNTINLGTVWGVPRLCELYRGICLTTQEKARKNLSQGIPATVTPPPLPLKQLAILTEVAAGWASGLVRKKETSAPVGKWPSGLLEVAHDRVYFALIAVCGVVHANWIG